MRRRNVAVLIEVTYPGTDHVDYEVDEFPVTGWPYVSDEEIWAAAERLVAEGYEPGCRVVQVQVEP